MVNKKMTLMLALLFTTAAVQARFYISEAATAAITLPNGYYRLPAAGQDYLNGYVRYHFADYTFENVKSAMQALGYPTE